MASTPYEYIQGAELPPLLLRRKWGSPAPFGSLLNMRDIIQKNGDALADCV